MTLALTPSLTLSLTLALALALALTLKLTGSDPCYWPWSPGGGTVFVFSATQSQ